MNIADNMEATTDKIIASYDLRKKRLAGLATDTRKTLKGFTSDRKKKAGEQKGELTRFVKGLSKSVEDMLNCFRNERSKRQKELIDKLTKEAKNIKADVKKLLNETDKLLGEYKSDMKKARGAWHSMASALARSRKEGMMPRIEAEKKVPIIAEDVDEKKKKKSKAAEERRKMALAYNLG